MPKQAMSRRLVVVGLLALVACDEASPEPECEELEQVGDAWLELGQGVREHEPLADGDTLRVYLGAQHLVMFALTLRVGGIVVPENPLQYTDELAPVVDIGVEIPGFEADHGYFRYVEGFPLALHDESDAAGEPSYVAVYVPVIFPDLIEPESVFGAEVTIHARVRPAMGPSVEVERKLVVGDELLSE